MEWYTMTNKKVNLLEAIAPYTKAENVLIHIGTDAQAKGANNIADFVTVVCVHMIDVTGTGKGGRVFYHKDKKVPTHSLWEKLYGETWRSLQVAVKLDEGFKDKLKDRIIVHVDANPDPIFKSSNYVKQLAGMVMGFGFKHILKPDAWAASHAADHVVKNKN